MHNPSGRAFGHQGLCSFSSRVKAYKHFLASVPRITMQCEAAKKGTGPQSYEICLKCPPVQQSILVAGLHRYGKNRIIDNGLLNFAIVTGFDDLLYLVVTDEKPNPNARRDWQHGLRTVTLPDMRKLPDVAEVQWVRHFTRFSQRRILATPLWMGRRPGHQGGSAGRGRR